MNARVPVDTNSLPHAAYIPAPLVAVFVANVFVSVNVILPVDDEYIAPPLAALFDENVHPVNAALPVPVSNTAPPDVLPSSSSSVATLPLKVTSVKTASPSEIVMPPAVEFPARTALLIVSVIPEYLRLKCLPSPTGRFIVLPAPVIVTLVSDA